MKHNLTLVAQFVCSSPCPFDPCLNDRLDSFLHRRPILLGYFGLLKATKGVDAVEEELAGLISVRFYALAGRCPLENLLGFYPVDATDDALAIV